MSRFILIPVPSDGQEIPRTLCNGLKFQLILKDNILSRDLSIRMPLSPLNLSFRRSDIEGSKCGQV
jgi:hypothetical protein